MNHDFLRKPWYPGYFFTNFECFKKCFWWREIKNKTSFKVFILKEHRKNYLKKWFYFSGKVFFRISVFVCRAIVQHIVQWSWYDENVYSDDDENVFGGFQLKCSAELWLLLGNCEKRKVPFVCSGAESSSNLKIHLRKACMPQQFCCFYFSKPYFADLIAAVVL